MNTRTLVLNNGFEVLNTVQAYRAVQLVQAGKADIVSTYPDEKVKVDNHRDFEAPAVIALRYYVRQPQRGLTWSARGVLERDKFKCQYCGQQLSKSARHGDKLEATVDHINPVSWFKDATLASTWSNTCCACKKCNQRKAAKSMHEAGMKFFFQGFTPGKPKANYGVIYSPLVPQWRIYIRDESAQTR